MNEYTPSTPRMDKETAPAPATEPERASVEERRVRLQQLIEDAEAILGDREMFPEGLASVLKEQALLRDQGDDSYMEEELAVIYWKMAEEDRARYSAMIDQLERGVVRAIDSPIVPRPYPGL